MDEGDGLGMLVLRCRLLRRAGSSQVFLAGGVRICHAAVLVVWVAILCLERFTDEDFVEK